VVDDYTHTVILMSTNLRSIDILFSVRHIMWLKSMLQSVIFTDHLMSSSNPWKYPCGRAYHMICVRTGVVCVPQQKFVLVCILYILAWGIERTGVKIVVT
jgi:hypothetical protein